MGYKLGASKKRISQVKYFRVSLTIGFAVEESIVGYLSQLSELEENIWISGAL